MIFFFIYDGLHVGLLSRAIYSVKDVKDTQGLSC